MPLSLRLARPAAGRSRTASTPSTGQSAAPRAAPSAAPIWLAIAVGAWASVAALAVTLYAVTPPQAGFDLELLLAAGRRVAAGTSPYDPALLAGSVPTAVDLFYSYPPPVAQYLSLFARVPSPLMLVAWAVAAVGGLAAVAVVLARRSGVRPTRRGRRRSWRRGPARGRGRPDRPAVRDRDALRQPRCIFPLLYGLMLLAALVPSTAPRGSGVGPRLRSLPSPSCIRRRWHLLVPGPRAARAPPPGAALAAPSAPACLGWRGLAAGARRLGRPSCGGRSRARDPRPQPRVGGPHPWSDYVSVVRAASLAAVVGISNVAVQRADRAHDRR